MFSIIETKILLCYHQLVFLKFYVGISNIIISKNIYHKSWSILSVFAFACNAKHFAIASLFFYFFSFSSVVLDARAKAFSYVSLIISLGECDQYQTDYIWHTRKRLPNKWRLNCWLRQVWPFESVLGAVIENARVRKWFNMLMKQGYQ